MIDSLKTACRSADIPRLLAYSTLGERQVGLDLIITAVQDDIWPLGRLATITRAVFMVMSTPAGFDLSLTPLVSI